MRVGLTLLIILGALAAISAGAAAWMLHQPKPTISGALADFTFPKEQREKPDDDLEGKFFQLEDPDVKISSIEGRSALEIIRRRFPIEYRTFRMSSVNLDEKETLQAAIVLNIDLVRSYADDLPKAPDQNLHALAVARRNEIRANGPNTFCDTMLHGGHEALDLTQAQGAAVQTALTDAMHAGRYLPVERAPASAADHEILRDAILALGYQKATAQIAVNARKPKSHKEGCGALTAYYEGLAVISPPIAARIFADDFRITAALRHATEKELASRTGLERTALDMLHEADPSSYEQIVKAGILARRTGKDRDRLSEAFELYHAQFRRGPSVPTPLLVNAAKTRLAGLKTLRDADITQCGVIAYGLQYDFINLTAHQAMLPSEVAMMKAYQASRERPQPHTPPSPATLKEFREGVRRHGGAAKPPSYMPWEAISYEAGCDYGIAALEALLDLPPEEMASLVESETPFAEDLGLVGVAFGQR